MWIINTATAIGVILLGVYWYIKKICHTYWKRKGVPYVEPDLIYGNVKDVITFKKDSASEFLQIYRHFKNKGVKHAGIYTLFKPIYLPIDLEILKCILQKDFNHFVNHGTYSNAEDDPLRAHLFHLEDAKWKNLRTKLTPTFTSGKMKMMFQTLVECSNGLEEKLKEYSIVGDAVDIKEILARFTTDVIGSCAFGLDCESLKNPDSEFRKYGKKVFEPSTTDKIKRLITVIFPHNWLRKIGYKMTDRGIENFFLKVVKDTVEYRVKNNIDRKDFMQLMIQLRNKGKITDDDNGSNKGLNNINQMTMNELSAQCFVFFIAGFETSSTTMTFALYELSRNQNIQKKLREEIRSVLNKHDGKLTYDSIMEMSYLDKIINETLRLHPPLSATMRVCNKAYPVPGTDLILEKGTEVHIPIYGIHMDPEYYPNPEVFDPERFSEENKAKRPAYTFLPFGEGPRICIGLRFGVMQSKVGLVRTIKDYNVTLNKKTVDPLEYDPKAFVLSVKGDAWLNVSRVDNNNIH